MQALQHYFASMGFAADDLETIMGCFTEKVLPKGAHFVQEGKTSRQLAFVQQGFLQYYILLDGVEKTTYTVGGNNFAVSVVSFLKESPAKENIRAVAETTLYIIDREQLRRLLEELPAFKSFYVELLEWQICCIDESRLDALMLTAQQRYEKMLEKEPDLLQNVPLQYLASILGVTPRHLSRIRNNIR